MSDDATRPRVECAKCGCRHFEVANTVSKAGIVRRRRVCRNCGRPLRTIEIPETPRAAETLFRQLMGDPKKN